MTQEGLSMVIGAAGQDGRLLCEKLKARGSDVVGLVKSEGKTLSANAQSLVEGPGFHVVGIDLRQRGSLRELVVHYRPRKIFYLAAVHHPSVAGPPAADYWRQMVDVNFSAVEELARAITEHSIECSVVYASSSQIWTPTRPSEVVNEESTINPATFYGHTKAWAAALLKEYRRNLGLQASIAILFNHESPLRPPAFVTRKITRAAADAARGSKRPLRLANIGATADWSAAADIVDGLVAIADAPTADDFILASGRGHSVKDFLAEAYGHIGLDWRQFVVAERDEAAPSLVGDIDKVSKALSWRPQHSFGWMVQQMLDADLKQPSTSVGV